MIATFIYIYPGVASGDGVWLVASSLFVSSFLYSPVFRIHARTRTPYTHMYTYTRFTMLYTEKRVAEQRPTRGVYYAARDTSRRWVREIRADKQEVKEVSTVCRRPVASPFHHGLCYKIL